MSELFSPISRGALARWVAMELEQRQALFGIPRALFFTPRPGDRFTQRLYGSFLETPFGPAAGPHTQMAQNIIAAWACGARFIELKTVQTLDRLDVPKPCIDMQDAGYNIEWSQELTLDESFEEYLRAWALVHILHRKLGFPGDGPGVIFNLSVGYNLEGIRAPNMRRFLQRARDAGDELKAMLDSFAEFLPEAREVRVPARLSNNVTLSTMHGCPPEEIGAIARHLMEEWELHTSVKLNPTLLGPERVRGILRDALGYHDIDVPDLAFEHDLKYPQALALIEELKTVACRKGLVFGVKLSNTLETVNARPSFSRKEKMAYLSGRPLHAITVNLARLLLDEFKGHLLVSFAGGADAFNAPRLLACGMTTVTACSDLLRPGGYTRLLQYIQNTDNAMADARADDLAAFTCRTAARTSGFAVASCDLACGHEQRVCARLNLKQYAEEVLTDPLYRRNRFDRSRTKTARSLGLFDCIKAPCRDACGVEQRVPLYMQLVREGRLAEAAEIVRADNPLGAVLGRACNHPCEPVCVRTHYDDPLAIREIKRFIMDHEPRMQPAAPELKRSARVAIIGGGPCGLSAAWFLASAGYPVTIFEARAYPGGMVAGSIPGYRATPAVIEQDLDRIRALGVEFRFNQRIGRDLNLKALRAEGFRYMIVAAGAQAGQRLGIPGEDAPGVHDALDFLRAARENRAPSLGKRVLVIGGGDVAMDCARTAWRLGADDVRVVYRRTRAEMPAQYEERRGLEEEGIHVIELRAPVAVLLGADGRVSALRCAKMKLGDPDATGRRRPVAIPGETEDIPADAIIVAISQQAALDFFDAEYPDRTPAGYLKVHPETMETSLPGIYAGGDAVGDGPATIVKAAGDGKRIARAIRVREEGPSFATASSPTVDMVALLRHRSRRRFREPIPELDPARRRNFEEIVQTLDAETARREAARCLDCNLLCSQCVAVCPNLAFFTYQQKPWSVAIPSLRVRGGRLIPEHSRTFSVSQRFQVAVFADFCNACGNCATFCPTAGAPYRDKPRIFWNKAEFERQSDNAFRLMRSPDAWGLEARWSGVTHTVWWNHALTYRRPEMELELETKTLAIRASHLLRGVPDDTTYPLEPCATMIALLRGLRDSAPWLPAAQQERIMS